ncbi:hypothetical protein PENTCL1PPCAC_22935, partial [Pristionchus entomophagus]
QSSLNPSFSSMPDELLADQSDPFISRSRRVSMMIEKGVVNNLQSYPKAVFYILGNEFCERFSFYGMRAILMVYFISEHGHSNSTALLLYHLFTCIAYFTPLLGSVVADSYLGRFKVIFYVSIFYVVGHALLSLGAIYTLPHFLRFGLDYAGLLIIAMCTGGIKPCVSAFAADQFDDSQKEERAQFFSFFYFAINAGSLFALALIPYLRGGIQCFGRDCFPLAFGVPGLLMLFALFIFIAGWNVYKKTPPSRENIAFRVAKCIGTALKRRWTSGDAVDSSRDWLEYAKPDYSDEMIISVRSFIDVAIIFMPLVLFWALFDQQGSSWVLQASSMDCRVGSLTVMAEQFSFVNPLLIIILVPLFEVLIYPCLKKFVNVTPLRKMAIGGILASLAFLVAGFIQYGVNKTIPSIPEPNQISLWTIGNMSIKNASGTQFMLNGRDRILNVGEYTIGDESFDMHNYTGKGVVVKKQKGTKSLIFPFQVQKPQRTMIIYVMIDELNDLYNGTMMATHSNGDVIKNVSLIPSDPSHPDSFIQIKLPIISDGEIHLKYRRNSDDKWENEEIIFGMGSVYVAHFDNGKMELMNVVEPNGMNLLWTIPQYVLITMGEILISVTGLEFAYSQASTDMKSVLQAMWLLTVCLGNLIDMGISGSHLISDPSLEFFFYAALMLGVMMVFILLATRYKYKDVVESVGMREGSKNEGNTLTLSSNDTPL